MQQSDARYGTAPLSAPAVLATAILSLAAVDGAAQHATAFDIEDGARAYENVCANCHGPDGDLIAGIDLGRGMFRRPLSDDQIVDIILNGIENTPMPATPGISEAQAREIVAWLRTSAANRVTSSDGGDPERGKMVFEGTGQCLQCHRVAGRGSRTGPDLTRIGLLRRAAELEVALLEPDALVQPENRTYRVVPRGGEPVVGRLLNHDTFTVQLIDADEKLRSFDKGGLTEHGFVASPMPSYREQLDPQAIADLVSYMSSLRGIE
ncbi:MAG TPA: c-type cytochrome [Gammaproteobacteria bacterium]|nr:c-type cytochrome [Gammaproteobacteria bacterium]